MRRDTSTHKGIKIVKVLVPRYEVRHVDGRKLRTFASLPSAKAWIDGYLKAVSAFTKPDGQP